MSEQFKPGDAVWFISKFGDRVTGIYDGVTPMPSLEGDRDMHIVLSDDAFGENSPKGVRCAVPIGLGVLHHAEIEA